MRPSAPPTARQWNPNQLTAFGTAFNRNKGSFDATEIYEKTWHVEDWACQEPVSFMIYNFVHLITYDDHIVSGRTSLSSWGTIWTNPPRAFLNDLRKHHS